MDVTWTAHSQVSMWLAVTKLFDRSQDQYSMHARLLAAATISAALSLRSHRKIERAPAREPEPCDPPKIKRVQRSVIYGGTRCVPVEQVVHPDFQLLDIAVVGGERVAGQERGRGRNDESPVS